MTGNGESVLRPRPLRAGGRRGAAAALPSSAAGGGPPPFDIGEILAILRRRFPVILGAVLLIPAIGSVYVSQLSPRYATEAWVMLDTRHGRLGGDDMMSGLEVDGAVVHSEIDILKSYPLAQKVATELQLQKEPEFNPSLRKPTAADYLQHPLGFVLAELRRLVLGPPPAPKPVTAAAGDIDSGLVWSLMGHVSVSSDGRSYLLRIQAQSESPALAAKIANAYAHTYLLDQLERKYDEVRRTSDWLNGHLTELRDKVRQSEDAVQVFKQQHNITETPGGTVTAQQLMQLNSQLVTAAAERAQTEASLRALQQEVQAGNVTASAVLNAPLVQKLRDEQATLLQRQAELATRYKPAHPTMVNLRAELQDVTRKLKEETDKAEAALSSDVAVARAREAALRQTLAELQRSTDQQDTASIELHELQREAAANQALYENFLAKFKQASTQADIQEPDARLVAPAIAPSAPFYPNRSMMMTTIVTASIALGVALAFLLEWLNNGFRTAEQVERELGVRALGLVPTVGAEETPHELVVERPTSPYSEAVRAVRTALRYTRVDRPPKLVLVTSSLPGEGKTMMALSLARSVARSGGKALLIDCDLRRPTVAKVVGCGTGRTLLDLFDGAAPETLIARDGGSGIDVVTAKGGTANPQDLLGSHPMQAFLADMRERYDLIVIDAPPVLVVSDAVVLSHLADATLFLIRWEASTRKSVMEGLRLLEADGAGVTGAVITRVDPRRRVRYGYNDAAYYAYHAELAESKAAAGS
ncbi:MAG TPA: polysaccharide biosynthesis tyrosine autokinase [Stellaceae bacterium]|nr:polysaccharide biosynthesis tyrosine autokinase [Stellaceae bacterium]